MVRRIVVVTGGFDPLHSGHIAYFKAASELGDILIVGLNSDAWLERKKGAYFMSAEDRRAVLEELECVDSVVEFDDEDGTAVDILEWLVYEYPEDKIIFANGGDRTVDNIPEMVVESDNLEFVFSVGGDDKKNSSSWILDEYRKKTMSVETDKMLMELAREDERKRAVAILERTINNMINSGRLTITRNEVNDLIDEIAFGDKTPHED